MPSATITVRFDNELFNRVKNHPINTSELIRTSVRWYLKELEDNTTIDNTRLYNEIQPVQQVKHHVLRKKTPVYTDVSENYFDASVMRKNEVNMYVSPEEISPLIEELTDKIDQLDDEIESLINKYQQNQK